MPGFFYLLAVWIFFNAVSTLSKTKLFPAISLKEIDRREAGQARLG